MPETGVHDAAESPFTMLRNERSRWRETRTCVLYSLLAICKLHGVNPFDYLRDVLMRVSSHPARDVLDLSPKAWKQKLKDLDAARSAPPPVV